MMSSTRIGEMRRTSEMMIEIAEKYQGNPTKVVAEVLFMLRSANRTDEKDLHDLQLILDEKCKYVFDKSNCEPKLSDTIISDKVAKIVEESEQTYRPKLG